MDHNNRKSIGKTPKQRLQQNTEVKYHRIDETLCLIKFAYHMRREIMSSALHLMSCLYGREYR